MARLRVYLAGPEVFLADAVRIGADKKRLCGEFGFEGLFPFDNEVTESENGLSLDRSIYAANIEMIASADFGIFNLTPFRGVSADAGTIFELGVFVGQGKPVFAYSNDERRLLERVGTRHSIAFDDERKAWIDESGMSIENFDNSDNLMIDCSLASQGRGLNVSSAEDEFRDLAGFVACLDEARR